MLRVRHERPEDRVAVRRVNERAFPRPGEADLVDALRAANKVTLSLVAVIDGRVVGHILFSPVTIESDDRTSPAVGLGPMAVLPEWQRRGIGSSLVKTGLAECRKAGRDCVVVLGHPGFYPRFGFMPASRFGITSRYTVPDEAFMIVAPQEGVLRGRCGVARYQPEFDAGAFRG